MLTWLKRLICGKPTPTPVPVPPPPPEGSAEPTQCHECEKDDLRDIVAVFLKEKRALEERLNNQEALIIALVMREENEVVLHRALFDAANDGSLSMGIREEGDNIVLSVEYEGEEGE